MIIIMTEEDPAHKVETLILEFNKSGLAYLVNSTPTLTQTSSQKPSTTSKKHNAALRKNSR
jgi:hypothetical protein